MSLETPSTVRPLKYTPDSAAAFRTVHMASATRLHLPRAEPHVSVEPDHFKPFVFIAIIVFGVAIWLASFRFLIVSELRRRKEAEEQKRWMDSHVVNLTSTLFEDAMRKCEAAWKEKVDLEKRNDQLNIQLRDSKILLAGKGDGMQGWAAFMEAAGWKGGRDGRTHSRQVSTVSTPIVGLDFRFRPQVVPPIPVQ